jgi:hypothetical protein
MERDATLNDIVYSLLEERTLVDDTDWDTLSVMVAITPGVADMTAFSPHRAWPRQAHARALAEVRPVPPSSS